ncbi:hypothetical protein ISG33_11155 [Glaciecola sp. MH2013]|uniref:hypothetical protein n=1 Tax=Glaciecola sp. MH2013 TaxID=2785524 RepID=UPI00189E9EDD|nr:hypothetical protein [Glaciecola sp. MH2013]MBF7073957.1 hypothetical protein [Glaciecola sp. MH2013]
MKLKEIEFRSEEEFVGNILIVVSESKPISVNIELKRLWITAQDYHNGYPEKLIETEFKEFERGITIKPKGVEEFKVRIEQKIKLIEDYLKKCQFEPTQNKAYELKNIVYTNLHTSTSVYILLDDLTEYCALVLSDANSMLVCWDDVV